MLGNDLCSIVVGMVGSTNKANVVACFYSKTLREILTCGTWGIALLNHREARRLKGVQNDLVAYHWAYKFITHTDSIVKGHRKSETQTFGRLKPWILICARGSTIEKQLALACVSRKRCRALELRARLVQSA